MCARGLPSILSSNDVSTIISENVALDRETRDTDLRVVEGKSPHFLLFTYRVAGRPGSDRRVVVGSSLGRLQLLFPCTLNTALCLALCLARASQGGSADTAGLTGAASSQPSIHLASRCTLRT